MITHATSPKRVGFLIGLFMLSAIARGQEGPTYQTPPAEMTDLLLAPPTPSVKLSPKNDYMLLLERSAMAGIADLAEPELRLGGLRINPVNNGQSRVGSYIKLTLKRTKTSELVPIRAFPAGRFTDLSWSPDGTKFAFVLLKPAQLELWMVDVVRQQARRLIGGLNDVIGGEPFQWAPDSRSLAVKVINHQRKAPPQPTNVPKGPIVQESLGKKAPARTYQDLLKNPYDEALFDYYLSAQLVSVTLTGEVHELLPTSILTSFSYSPNGRYLLTVQLHKPYSYLTPYANFPKNIDIVSAAGKPVKRLTAIPLMETLPLGFDAVRQGMRAISWRADAPATLVYAEAQDGGDPAKKTTIRDQVYLLPAPFTNPRRLATLNGRFQWVSWGTDSLAMIAEGWWKTRNQKMWLLNPADTSAQARLLFDLNTEDVYKHPGYPLAKYNQAGREVLLTTPDNRWLYFVGDGASPDGKRPFVNQVSIGGKEQRELWRSQAPYYETLVDVLDPVTNQLLIRRESVSSPANYVLRNLSQQTESVLTNFPHPYPALKDIRKELLTYERNDGVKLTAKVYLPAGYSLEKGPLPTLIWAYPREYKNAEAAGQVKDSPYQFTRLGWAGPLYWLTQGYAIVDDPDLPIIGQGDTQPNDSYVEQLTAGAEALVRELVKRNIADKNRIAIGGHSYGAFMTVNLLAHTNLFAAGIARSGAYNRTLTPFGFQTEERTIWGAPDVYMRMSPFMYANKIKTPLLILHGEADNNAGTFPLQSERLFNAVKGNGGTVRYVQLPLESHSYSAKESVLHTLYEMNNWLDKYVKNRPILEAALN
ncbi:S9 family peptidase [Spirosoma oryzicola]|uniref:S9 family peptidase n=1 Tax=Spirosoma oryzicola TaxID=2898794 RepID=UPI001E2B46AF|nr:prolyl oligopeptidase family serine peptidase [Spirosoma oryzicola]UHG94927.1 prolyl oligopeptidase family serine peptidase [Spirosoma oryzicola]